jgi:hypothetical protein
MFVWTQLQQRRRLAVAIVLVSGLLAVTVAAINGGLLPPGGTASLKTATAATHVMVDVPPPSLVYRRVDVLSLVRRGQLLASILGSRAGLDLTAKRAGIPADQLTGLARTVGDVPTALTDPGLEQRASQIVDSKAPYRLEAQARGIVPIIDIYTQAPTAGEAEGLGNAAAAALGEYLDDLSAQENITNRASVIRQLGSAHGTAVLSHAPEMIAVFTFILVFGLLLGSAFFALWLRWRKVPRAPEPVLPVPTDNWPHTNRAMPWALAGFIAMLWLVPFNQIKLDISFPIDLGFDRLVLPPLFVIWVFAFAVGGRGVRVRLTWIHAAIGLFVTIAFISVVLDGRYLAHILELDLAVKQLPLLLSYMSLFLITSTTVRPGEVRAYINFTLILAVINAIGMVYEYRMISNPFYNIAGAILPGVFSIENAHDGVLDSLGRTEVHGPAQPGVEAVTMLSMALPIAIVGFMHARHRRDRILYSLAMCVLVAAMVATLRKSALIAPGSVAIALAFFRRRELLKLAPVGLLLGVVVTALAPGALRSTLNEFLRSDAASVPTTSDRTSDYDAIRPDLWSHLTFGRGWGTYNHESYRILDSEVLHRLVDVGVFGLLAFIGIGVAVVVSARSTIRERDPAWAPLALIGACTAVCFTCASTLYDSLSFPHATYIFLYMAALTAVLVGRPPDRVGHRAQRAQRPVPAAPYDRLRPERTPASRALV